MLNVSSLTWGIKTSLLEYVESLEDGAITVSAPAVREGMLCSFSLDEAASDFDADTQTGVLQSSGSVVLSGYGGQMRIELTDPRMTLQNGAGFLAIRLQSMFTGERFEPIAAVSVSATEPTLVFDAKLTPAGCSIFGPQYQAGQELSPISVS
jgi:hypothetical protein